MIAILAILSVGAFIYIGFQQGVKLEAAAEKLAADLRYAQSQAMSYTLWHGVSFELNPTNSYTVYRTNGTTDTPIDDPAKFGSPLTVNVHDKFGVIISSVNLEGGAHKVEFNGLGRPYTDYSGWIVSQEGVVVLSLGSSTKTITITPQTGKVAIQ